MKINNIFTNTFKEPSLHILKNKFLKKKCSCCAWNGFFNICSNFRKIWIVKSGPIFDTTLISWHYPFKTHLFILQEIRLDSHGCLEPVLGLHGCRQAHHRTVCKFKGTVSREFQNYRKQKRFLYVIILPKILLFCSE